MGDDEDNWPPDYNPGPPRHLHAIGVISLQFNMLERSIDRIYINKAAVQNIPEDLAHLYYYSLSEEKRVEALRLMFRAHEADQNMIDLIENLITYFQWCRNCRNQILHAEQYPQGLGYDPNILMLTKRVGKQRPAFGYLKFKLASLREIADKMRDGVVRCAEIHIYLMYRNYTPEKIPEEYRAFVTALPGTLIVPKHLALNPDPS